LERSRDRRRGSEDGSRGDEMVTEESDSIAMGREKGWVGAPEVEGGRIDPDAMLSFSNFFIFPVSILAL
jgi:hypothetical protein